MLVLALLVSMTACSHAHAPAANVPGASTGSSVAVQARQLLTIEALSPTSLVGLWSDQQSNGVGTVRLAFSANSGQTWRSVGTALPRSGQAFPPPAMAFVSTSGGVVEVEGQVYATTDSGGTWKPAYLGERVTALSINHGTIWAVGRRCPPGGGKRDQCAVYLWASTRAHPLVLAERLGGGLVAARYGTDPLLLRSGAHVGLVTGVGGRPGNNTFVTANLARGWSAASSPCSVTTPVRVRHHRSVKVTWIGPEAVAAGSGAHPHWWVLCYGQASAGTETKGLEIATYQRERFVVEQAYGAWSQIAAFPSTDPYRNPAHLPTGHVGRLYALSNTALLQTDQNVLAVSTDAGRDWRTINGLNFEGDGDWVTFTGGNGEPLWLLVPHVGLWRSPNGIAGYRSLAAS